MELAAIRQQVFEWRQSLRYRAARRQARPALPPLPARLAPVLTALEREGAYVTSLEFLGADPDLLPELDRLVATMPAAGEGDKDYVIHAPDDAVLASRAVLHWGLGEDLLALCANYIGLPVAYRGVTVRRDLANGVQTGTRVWHRDGEDDRIVKCIVYVNDVDHETGPFEYIAKRDAPPTWRVPVYDGNRVREDFVAGAVPRDRWRPCVGPRGTVVVVDTCAVYHRGRVPVARDRLTAFYCYNSVRPVQPQYCQPLFDRERFTLRNELSALQAAALRYRY